MNVSSSNNRGFEVKLLRHVVIGLVVKSMKLFIFNTYQNITNLFWIYEIKASKTLIVKGQEPIVPVVQKLILK